MPRTRSVNPKQSNFSYQSLYLWTSFLLGMISLGFVVWNRKSVIPAKAGIQSSFSEFLDSRSPINVEDKLHGNDGKIFSNFASSLALCALAYQLPSNYVGFNLLIGLNIHFVFAQLSSLAASDEFRINTYTMRDQGGPQSVCLNNGNVVVVWQSDGQDGSGSGIFGQLYNPIGVKVGAEFQVNSNAAGDQRYPKVTALSNGGFAVIYADLNRGTYMQVFNENATKIDAEFGVTSDTTTFGFAEPDSRAIAGLDGGKFVVSWSSGRIPEVIYAQQFNNSNTKVNLPFLISSNNFNRKLRPTVIKVDQNRFIIGWQELISTSWTILIQAFDSTGNKIGANIQCSPDNADYPALTDMGDKNFVISFIKSKTGSPITYRRIYSDSLLPVSNEFPTDFGAYPAVIPVKNNSFAIGRVMSSANPDLYMQLYDLSGNPIIQQFQINIYNASMRSFGDPKGSLLQNGNIFITWVSFNQTGQGWDIYGRILNITEILNPTNITSKISSVSTLLTSSTRLNLSTFFTSRMSSTSISTLETTSQLSKTLGISTSQLIKQETSQITQSVTVIDTTEPASTEKSVDANNIGVIAGGIAGAFAAGALIMVAGFFAVNKCRKSKSNVESNKNEVALQNRSSSTQQSSRNYGEIDATRKDSCQYDRPVELKI